MSSNSEEIERLRAENERLRAQVENAARYGVLPSLHPTQADIAEEQKLETDIIAEALSTKAFTIVVLGASGDLAKKKTYPALFALFRQGLIPPFVTVCGFSRTAYTDVEFRSYLDSNVLKGGSPEHREAFLARCVYFQGHYDSSDSYAALHQRLLTLEAEKCGDRCDSSNRIFYFAIPPSIYADVANAMRPAALTTTGFNRLIVEKPFGRDLQSFASLNETLMSNFTEDQVR
jgi:glucose-6-phosphate 1-dehydrogenase